MGTLTGVATMKKNLQMRKPPALIFPWNHTMPQELPELEGEMEAHQMIHTMGEVEVDLGEAPMGTKANEEGMDPPVRWDHKGHKGHWDQKD